MTSDKKLKIAVRPLGGDKWLGGKIFTDSLLRAIRDRYQDAVSLYMMTVGVATVDPKSAQLYDGVIQLPSPPRYSPGWLIENGAKAVLGKNLSGSRLLAEHGIDVVAFDMGLRLKVPSLPWLPDFQHRHMPAMFSAGERSLRERAFKRIAERAPLIIVQTETVRRELEAFYPFARSKARVLSPVSDLPPGVWKSDPGAVCGQHGLPSRFVYLPNQFWKHKNHTLAFKAVGIAKSRGTRINLVCSGLQTDYRHPGHYSDLLTELGTLGIGSQVTVLGVIPRNDVFSLIRQSVCLLNPSLSEGFGMSIDEARSVGKQVLASNIPVHIEQQAPNAVYFDPLDPEDLAEKMIDLWENSAEGPDATLEENAREAYPARKKGYAEGFIAIAREVLSSGAVLPPE